MRDKAYGLAPSEDGDECGKEGDETGNVQQDIDQADGPLQQERGRVTNDCTVTVDWCP